jgi:hypothetical protein
MSHRFVAIMTTDERLFQYLKEGKDWQRKATNVPGVFLLKLPAFKGRSATLAIEINPIDSFGFASKKRGVLIRSKARLEEMSRLLSNPKLSQLAKSIDEVNPLKKSPPTNNQENVFEI